MQKRMIFTAGGAERRLMAIENDANPCAVAMHIDTTPIYRRIY
jgi:hypothetical protein